MTKVSRRAWALGLALLAPLARAGAAAPYQHVLLLSLDGLHDADLTDPATSPYLPSVLDIANHGIHYTNAYAVKPTDNFPNMIAQVTGAGPKTSGIYYDTTYNRAYYPAATFTGTPPGTTVLWTADIDKDPNLLSGGGNADISSINPILLPQVLVNGTLQRVYPHNDLKVNTVFEVAHNAGLRTAYIDKHPSYEIVSGPSGQGLDDFFGLESDAKAVLIDGLLKDATNAPAGVKLKSISKSIPMSEAYDDMRVDALINQINGKTSAGAPASGAPALFGMSFIAVNTAEKDPTTGGIDNFGGGNIVNPGLADAMSHTDNNVNRIVSALKAANLYDSTLIVLTAKHGQSPRVGTSVNETPALVTSTLSNFGINVRQTTDDDVSLVWLDDPSRTTAAAADLLQSRPDIIDKVLTGQDLASAVEGNSIIAPAGDDRAPDLIVQYKPGVLLSSSLKRSEHGGLSEDDSHIALLLGGALPPNLQGTTITDHLLDTQLAPTMLEALGLDPTQLQGAIIDGTTALPGAGLPVPEPTTTVILGALAFQTTRRSRRRGA
jgi:predicted AlkP superfamily pyrophosphatase or phosphodiesterase